MASGWAKPESRTCAVDLRASLGELHRAHWADAAARMVCSSGLIRRGEDAQVAGLIDLPDLQAVVRDPLAGTCLGGSTPAGVSWHQLELIAVDLRSQCLDLVTPEFEYSRLVAGLLDITTSEFDFVQQVLCIGHPAIVAGRRSAA